MGGERDEGRSGPPAAGLLAVLGLALIAAVPSLFARDLWGGQEIRLTEGAREMVALGDWRVPRLNGEPLPDRPPLSYWATGLLWKAGAGMRSARVLALLSVVALVLACYAATAREYGARTALLAAAAVLTTATVFLHARTGGLTPLPAFLITAAILAGYRGMRAAGWRAPAWWLAAYAAMALGLPAGGLLGPAVPAITLLVYAVASRAGRRPRLGGHVPGLLLAGAIVGAWFALCGSAIGGLPGAVGALTGDVAGLWGTVREGDLPESAVAGVLAFFPWIVLTPAAAARALRGGGGLRLLAVIWLGVLALPVLLAGESHIAYAMPAAVPLGILCASALSGAADEAGSQGAMKHLTGAALALFSLLAGAVLLVGLADLAGVSYLIIGEAHVCPVTLEPYSPYALAAGLAFVAVALVLLVRGLFVKPLSGLRRAFALVAAVVLLGIPGDLFLSPFLNSYLSARPFAQIVAGRVEAGDELQLFRKDYDGVYNLYLGRVRIPVIAWAEELPAVLARDHSYVICDEKRLKRAHVLEGLKDRKVAGGNVGGRYMMLLRGGPQ